MHAMSRTKKLLILLLVALLLIGLYAAVRTLGGDAGAEGDDAAGATETIPVLDISSADVQEVTCAYLDYTGDETSTQTFTLKRTDDGWVWAEDTSAAPDQDAVESMLETVTGLSASRRFDLAEGADLAEYGLDAPSSRITLTVSGSDGEAEQTYTLLTGSYNEMAAAYYAMLEGDSQIYMVDGSYEDSIKSLRSGTDAE